MVVEGPLCPGRPYLDESLAACGVVTSSAARRKGIGEAGGRCDLDSSSVRRRRPPPGRVRRLRGARQHEFPRSTERWQGSADLTSLPGS